MVTKMFIATDSAIVENGYYELVSDMIDVLNDISLIYGTSSTSNIMNNISGGNSGGGGGSGGGGSLSSVAGIGMSSSSYSTTNGGADSQIATSPAVVAESYGNDIINNPSNSFDILSQAIIHLENGKVLYLREVNRNLGLACILKKEKYSSIGLIKYNFLHFKKALNAVLSVKSQMQSITVKKK